MKTDLTPSQCRKILAANYYAHMGFCEDGEPYVLPITYVYKDDSIYSYSQKGHKIEAMRKNPAVCIQVERVESGFEWESVLCWGTFAEVTDPENMQDVKLLLAEKYGQLLLTQGKVPVSPLVETLHERHSGEINTSVIYRITPYRMSGKAEKHTES